MRRWVRRPLIQFDGRRIVSQHGPHHPVRGAVHTTESGDAAGARDLMGVAYYWNRQQRGLGAHIIIDKDGNSALCVNPDRIAWAVRGYNTGVIHIELISFARFVPKLWWVRPKQLKKLAKWIAWINLEYGIPIEHAARGWLGHREFPGQDHTDPGRFFPWRYVIRKAKQFRKNGWT